MALLTIRDLSFSYPGTEETAISNINLTVDSGELVTVVGATGSGKSTLLRLLKPELRHNGTFTGSVTLEGREITALSPTESAQKIGFVAQNPEEQIVTDRVWHELAFTLENLGAKQQEIARRVAETAAYFGIGEWFRKETSALSGGQKQLLNLAAVMTAAPDLLVLDEPTAQLDPIAAARFIEAVRRLCCETGLAVLITEHRAEELLPISDRMVILDHGRIAYDGSPRGTTPPQVLRTHRRYLTAAQRLSALTDGDGDAPLSITEGRRYVKEHFHTTLKSLVEPPAESSKEVALEIKNVFFRYERHGEDILRSLSLTVKKGEIFAVLGANGAGKSTMVKIAAGLLRPLSGTVKLFGQPLKSYRDGSLYQGNISLLPQEAESVSLYDTVRRELADCETGASMIPYDFTPLLNRHPYDLSGGERQLLALCRALNSRPRLLILDEPSKGLDPDRKAMLADLIRSLKESGTTILLVSHDVDFAALCADRCALFFDGGIASCDTTAAFLRDNRFYTTPAARITRGLYDDGYTVERAAALMMRNGRKDS
jgi:energy-coupling factor transport system ATP-binding protein